MGWGGCMLSSRGFQLPRILFLDVCFVLLEKTSKLSMEEEEELNRILRLTPETLFTDAA